MAPTATLRQKLKAAVSLPGEIDGYYLTAGGGGERVEETGRCAPFIPVTLTYGPPDYCSRSGSSPKEFR